MTAAPRRPAQPGELVRGQDEHQHLGGRACRHDVLDRLRQDDAPAGGIHEVGRARRTGTDEEGGKQHQKQRRAAALLAEPRGRRAKRHRTPQFDRELVSRTITITIVRANNRVDKTRYKGGAGRRQHTGCRALAAADNRIAAAILPRGRALVSNATGSMSNHSARPLTAGQTEQRTGDFGYF